MTASNEKACGIPLSSQADVLSLDHIRNAREKGILPNSFKSPVSILWDLTYHCTLRCIHCYNCSGPQRGRQYDELDRDELMRVVDYVIDEEVLSVCLSGGDVLINKHFWEIAARIASAKLTTASTIINGWLVTPKITDKIARYFEAVEVSIDGATAETHDHIRGRSGSFQRVIETVAELSHAGVRVMVAFSGMSINFTEFRHLIDQVARYDNVESITTGRRVIPLGRAYERPDLHLTDAMIASLEAQVEAARRDYPNVDIGTVDNGGSWLTQMAQDLPNQRMLIEPDGTVKMVPFVPFTFGNVKTDDLTTIWNTHMATAASHPAFRQYIATMMDTLDLRDQRHIPFRTDDIPFDTFAQQAALN